MRVGEQAFVLNTSLEFVVVGPSGKHRRVLARSENSRSDLVGLDDEDEFKQDIAEISAGLLTSFATNNGFIFNRRLKVVSSRQINTSEDTDYRFSYYSFIWRGSASFRQRLDIKDLFDSKASDISSAFQNGDPRFIEWELGPIILACERAIERSRRRRFAAAIIFMGFLFLYASIFVSIFAKWVGVRPF